MGSLETFIIASALLSIAPGPDNLFVLAHSALYGRQSGILITLGLCSGLIVHTLLVALGVAAVLQTSDVAFSALKIAGACYLAYLAWQIFRSRGVELGSAVPLRLSNSALYRRGVIMNVTNPKVAIFFLAFLPQFATPENGPIAPQIFFLGGLFMLVALIIFSAVALLAGTLGQWLQNSPRAQLHLKRLAGTVFAGLALKLATTQTVG